jgi:hypothetical protein
MTRGTASSGKGLSSPAKSKVTPCARYDVARASVLPRNSSCVILASAACSARYGARAWPGVENISSNATAPVLRVVVAP